MMRVEGLFKEFKPNLSLHVLYGCECLRGGGCCQKRKS